MRRLLQARRSLLALFLAALLVTGASCSKQDGAAESGRLPFRVVAQFQGDMSTAEQEQLLGMLEIELREWLGEVPTTVAHGGILPLMDDRIILVTYEEADKPCEGFWSDGLEGVDDAELLVVFGGVIRSELPFRRHAGYYCSAERLTGPLGSSRSFGAVLVDLVNSSGDQEAGFVTAHELGHAFGLSHNDDPGNVMMGQPDSGVPYATSAKTAEQISKAQANLRERRA